MRGPARSGGQAPVRRERAWMTAYCHSDHSLCRVDGERCRVTLSRLRASQLTVSVRQSKMSCASRFQPFISRGRRVRGRANESPCEAAIGSHGDLAPLGPHKPSVIGRVPHAPALLLLLPYTRVTPACEVPPSRLARDCESELSTEVSTSAAGSCAGYRFRPAVQEISIYKREARAPDLMATSSALDFD